MVQASCQDGGARYLNPVWGIHASVLRGQPAFPQDRILGVNALILSSDRVPIGSQIIVGCTERLIGSYSAVRLSVSGNAYFWIDELRVGNFLVAGGGLPAEIFAPGSRLARTWLLLPKWAGPEDEVIATVTYLGSDPGAFHACLDITGNVNLIDPEAATPVLPGSSAAQAQDRSL